MSTSQIIYDATTKKLSDFKNVYEYTSHYQAFFDKLVNLLTETSSHTCKSTEIYFQAIMLMNIGVEYSVLVSSIQKDWKDENINLSKAVLQIIKHFEFMERNVKAKIMQTSAPSIDLAPKGSYTNKKCVEKELTTYYTN